MELIWHLNSPESNSGLLRLRKYLRSVTGTIQSQRYCLLKTAQDGML